MNTEDTELFGRSNPDPVDQPARTIVHHYNSTQYCSTETVQLIFSCLQTNIRSQMRSSGGQGTTYEISYTQKCCG